MSQPTPKKRVLFVRSLWLVPLVLFGVFSILALSLRSPKVAEAATSNTINFQARLQTAAGGIVPDGNYNVEFKLYSASSGGSALWTEDYLNSAGKGLPTRNGYLTANLGSVTAFAGINWDQQLWLTMNIGGTVTTGNFTVGGGDIGDGEMNPRLPLTAVPYAFSAGQLNNTGTGGRSTLSFAGSGSGHGDQNFVLQDQGAAGTYNLLTTTQADTGYIQNQTAVTQVAGFNINGTGTIGTLNATTALQTAGVTRIDDSGNLTDIGNISASGTLQVSGATGSSYIMSALGLGTTNPQSGAALTIANSSWISGIDSSGTGYINMFQLNSSNEIQVGAALNIDGGIVLPTDAGQVTFADLPISTSATAGSAMSYTFRVGSSNVLTVYGEADGSGNLQNGRIAVGSSITPQYPLDVTGDINTSTGYRVGGTAGVSQGACSVGDVFSATTSGGIVTGGSCTAVALGPGSTYYIQNGTSPQTADFNITGTGIAGILQASTFDTASAGALGIGTTNATSIVLGQNTSLASGKTFTANGTVIDGNGNITVASGKTLTANGSGFDASGNLGIGTTTPGANIDVQSGATTGNAINITANSLTTGSAINVSDTQTVTTTSVAGGTLLNATRSLAANVSGGAIAIDTNGNATNASYAHSLTYSFTVGSVANRYLVVSVSTYTVVPTSVTFDGAAMTLISGATEDGSNWVTSVYGLAAPAVGTHDIVITSSNNVYGVLATDFYNVNQSTPIGTPAIYTAFGASASVSLSTSIGQLVIDSYKYGDSTATPGAGQTVIQTQTGYLSGGGRMKTTYKPASAGTTSMSETQGSSSDQAYIAVALNPTTAGIQIDNNLANLSSNCTSIAGGCADTSNILNLNQQYAGATGAVAVIQNAGTGDMLDLLNGSGTVVAKFDASGNLTANGVNSVTGYSTNGTAGLATLSCSGGQFLQNPTIAGGIVTAGACASAAAGLTGSGTDGTIAMFSTSGTNLGNSLLTQSSGTITVGGDLTVTGDINTSTLDTASSGTLNIGTTNASGITIGSQNILTTVPGPISINGDFTGTVNAKLNISGALNSSYTGFQYGISGNVNFNPQGASVSAIVGFTGISNLTGSSLNVPSLTGAAYGISTGAGYTGQVANGVGLSINGPIIGGSQLIPAYYGAYILQNANNGGNTSGTITNEQLKIGGITAGAGTGGTLNNYGIYLSQPSGSGGTTNNYGLYITGAGGGTSNYSIYNNSSALSYLTGSLTSAGTVQAATVNATSGYQLNGTAGATTTCTGGQFLQNQVVQGGITTGGTCASAAAGLTGSGTDGTIAMFSTSGTNLGNSILTQSGTTITVGGGATITGNLTVQGTGTNAFTGSIDAGAGVSTSINGVRTYENVYSKGTTGAVTGTLEIILPAQNNSMLNFTIKGYDYTGTTGTWQVNVSGFLYTNNTWLNSTAQMSGNAPFTSVRLAYNTTLGQPVLLLGTTGTVWAYPQVSVTQVVAGYANQDVWGKGYTSSFITSETGITSIASPAVPHVATSDNAFLQGGNSFGTSAVLGTNDSNSVSIKTGGTTRFTIDTSGNASFTGTVSGADATANNQFVTLGQLTGAVGGVGGGVDTVGAIDGGTYSANGASISGTTIYLQAATGSHVGLVTTGTQTFAGAKTFNDYVTLNGGGEVSGQLNVSTAVLTPAVATDILDSYVSTTLNIGQTSGGTATAISLNQSTTVASGKDLTVASGHLNVNGAPSASAISSLIRIGNAISGGNSSTNGGTYIGLNAPNTGAGSAADFLNFQKNGTSNFLVDNTGFIWAQGGLTTDGQITVQGAAGISAGGVIDAGSGFSVNGTAGSTTSCTGGYVLQNATVSGGIITGGTCVANGGGIAPTLQDVYNNSTNPATITLTSTNHGITIQDASTTVGGNLFAVQSNGGATKYLTVTTSGATVAGTLTVSTAIQTPSIDSISGSLTVGASASSIIFGSSTNGITFTAAGGLVASGTAQHGKSIVLPAEYAGAVLDAQSDSSCSSANSGTMTSGFDGTNRMNYYNWTATGTTTQCYDVVVQVQIPKDWSSWDGSDPLNIQTKSSNTSNTAVSFQILNASGTADTNYNFGSFSQSTSWSDSAGSSFSGTYAAGDVITIKIRMSAKNSANLQIGKITLNYNSKY